MRSFASDNNSGVHPAIMEALTRANRDHALGYGDDLWTEEAVRKIKETFVADCEPLFQWNRQQCHCPAIDDSSLQLYPLCRNCAHLCG